MKAVDQEVVQSEIFEVYNKRIEDCRHCNWCMGKQRENDYCMLKDAYGIKTARATAESLLELARIIKTGKNKA